MNTGNIAAFYKRADKVLVSILALGVLLRIFQYCAGTCFWGDELSVVRNVTSRDTFELLAKPLSDEQVAPCGFLFLLKVLAETMGTNEYSMRFIPLLSSLLALPLFAILARKSLPREAMLCILFVFSMSPPLIRYAAQVKPYSSDVLISLLCLMVAGSWLDDLKSLQKSVLAAATGSLVIWFSYPSVYVIAAIGLFVLARCIMQPTASYLKHSVAVLAVWFLATGSLALVEHRRLSAGTQTYMQKFWMDWMFPLEHSLYRYYEWFVRIVQDFLSNFLLLPKWPLLFVLVVVGSGYLLFRSRSDTVLLLGPLLITFVASVLRYYPFRGRVILFLVPIVLILLGAGVLALTDAMAKVHVPRYGQQSVFLLTALLLGFRPIWKNPPLYRDSETKPILSYLGTRHSAGDPIYVHNMAWHAYEFYGPRYSLSMDQATISALRGKYWNGSQPSVVMRDLDQFRGQRRLWVVFGGGYPEEMKAAIWYLDTIGTRRECQSSYNASVYLYDLDDAARLRSAKAEDFFTEPRQVKGCDGKWIPGP